MGLLDDLDKRRGQVEITLENRSRLAQAYGNITTTGQGVLQFEDPIEFGVTFVELPPPGYCAVVDVEDLADELGFDDPEVVPLPHCTGYVTEWDQDENGFYIGAWVAVKVTFDSFDLVDPTATVEVTHHFTFRGIAMKTVPVDLSDASAD